ncbi:gamma-glutamyl-gamma-aminobutyrate hydrolase family protein [Arthrobacter sp. SIMBA_036]
MTLGGTLHQHLPDIAGTEKYQRGGYQFNMIPVMIRPDSTLARLTGLSLDAVPVSHHQAVDKLGRGLIASAWSEDLIIEAIEYPANTFTVGVQWHPEELAEEFGLFQGFIDAARAKRMSGPRLATRQAESAELGKALDPQPAGALGTAAIL